MADFQSLILTSAEDNDMTRPRGKLTAFNQSANQIKNCQSISRISVHILMYFTDDYSYRHLRLFFVKHLIYSNRPGAAFSCGGSVTHLQYEYNIHLAVCAMHIFVVSVIDLHVVNLLLLDCTTSAFCQFLLSICFLFEYQMSSVRIA
jgi:hypothetical protein